MKKAIIAILCLAILCGGGYFGYRHYKKSRDEKTVVDVVRVNQMAVSSDMYMFQSNETSGRISAANAQKVYVDTEKLVQTVCVKKGQKVKKGDTILEYDMTVVELELAQKENEVHIIEQDLKMGQKKLNEIRNYAPSEDAPPPPEPDHNDEPDPDSHPDVTPIMVLPELTGASVPLSGTGTEEDPLLYACNPQTIVRKPFLMKLASSGRTASLSVYNEASEFMYQWILNGEALRAAEPEDWCVSEGLLIDADTGMLTIDPDSTLHGKLSFSMPQGFPKDQENLPEDMMPADEIPADVRQPDLPDLSNTGSDYQYSRKEIQQMAAEQESYLRNLEIKLKQAKLAYETALKQKSDGKVTATVDGIVKKIGKAADENGEEEQQETDPVDPFAQPAEDDNAFAVIEGESGVEVICETPELMLPKLPKGTVITVQSYRNGMSAEAEITEVEKEPFAYNTNPWSANPNSSMYYMHAKLHNSDDFTIGDWVGVTLPQGETNSPKKKTFYIPLHYVRQEGGDYYVMAANDDDRLEKRYVSVGQLLWGEMIEVTGGLDKRDRICFPYGTDVKEGIRTQDSTEVLYRTYY